MTSEPIACISNGAFKTSIGYSMGFPTVKWKLTVSDDIQVKWMHGLQETDISGRLGVLLENRTYIVDDQVVN